MERQLPSSSSDEDDDGEALIAQNGTKVPPSPRRVASFEIGRLSARIGRGLGSTKKYILAVCLPLILILIYFSVDVSRLFHGVSAVRFSPPVEDQQMREAELRALYLLRNQQLGLLRLWNRTSSSRLGSSGIGTVSPPPLSPPISSSNSTRNSTQAAPHDLGGPLQAWPSVSFEEFRSALLEQIKLNQQIQKALLSTHRSVSGNTSSEEADGNVDDLLSGSGAIDVCRKVDKPAERRTIEWKPKKNRYLFAICLSGQMSNHLICLQKHMFFAALLGRTLVLPSRKFDFHYDRVIDIEHIKKCLGRKVVISFEEFSVTMKNKMRIDRFRCYESLPPCFVDEEHEKRLKALGLSLSNLEAAWPEDAKLSQPKKRTVNDIMSKFSYDDEVLAIGDMFYADVEEEWVMQPGGPIAHKCETLIQPSRHIVLTAQRFVQTFLGRNYIALHFRRHGFLKFCNLKAESCFFPIPQAAECILRVLEKANAPVIYLSTDAADSETNLLQSLVVLNDKKIPLIKRPDHNSVEKWDVLLYRNHLGGDKQVEAMLDKTICAMSNVFVGSSGSTFTDDIFRLRRDWASASVCDENLCNGERPNYIAEKE